MRIIGLIAAMLLAACFPASAQEPPFGLRWGAGVEELTAHGVLGDIQQDDGQIMIFVAKKLPESPPYTDVARLAIDRSYGLQRIIWLSKDLTDDPQGTKGMAVYNAMKSFLTEKYGDPRSSDEEMPATQDRSRISFYQCLAQDGCGTVVSIWRTIDTDIRERLIGMEKGTGWLEVVFIGPDWTDVVSEKKKQGQK